MFTNTYTLLSDGLNLLFPALCAACTSPLERHEQIVCTSCRLTLPYNSFDDPRIYKRFHGRLPIHYAYSMFDFQKHGRVQAMVHALKYKGNYQVGVHLGYWFAEQLKAAQQDTFDCIVAVPLHPKKRKLRGYNQSEMFAKGISEQLGIPLIDDALQKRDKTTSQTRFGRFSRWKNIEEGFFLSCADKVIGKNVLLVDDILTTGATLDVCGNALLTAPVNSLSIGCIAIAEK